MNAARDGRRIRRRPAPAASCPQSITDMGLGELRVTDFIKPTSWPTIDIVPSCANAAFVEFASAQYRHMNPEWSFFAAVSRYLDSAAGRRLRPDPVRLPARHRLSVHERGLCGRRPLYPVRSRLLGIRFDDLLHRPAVRSAGGSVAVLEPCPRGDDDPAQDVP